MPDDAMPGPVYTEDIYILEGHTVVPCHDFLKWARWFETADRRVAQETIGPYFVSTVFLGLDHNFAPSPNAPPLLFETMVFRRTGAVEHSDYVAQERCSTWEEAEAQHQRLAAQYRREING
jgi:hypothetical protein